MKHHESSRLDYDVNILPLELIRIKNSKQSILSISRDSRALSLTILASNIIWRSRSEDVKLIFTGLVNVIDTNINEVLENRITICKAL